MVDIDKEYVRKNGEVVWGRTTAVVISSRNQPNRLIIVVQDVTAQKRAEAVLRESEERFRIVANDTPAYLWMTSTDNSFIFVNRKLAEFLGTKPTGSEAELASFIHPDDADRVLGNFRKCRAAGAEYHDEMRVRRHDSVYRLFSSQAVPRRSPSGAFLGYAGSLLDITELKQAEQRLLSAHDQLAAELQERRRAEQEILALNERLINTNEEVQGRLARELHDDFGQRVAAVSISLSNLKRQIPAHMLDARKDCARIQQTLFDLAESIRHLSRQLHPALLEHSGIRAALEAYCREFTELSGIAVSLEAGSELGDIPSTAALCMYRVAQEALQNVLRHAQAKSAVVRLERLPGSVRMSIADRGVGFDAARADSSGGLGLLSMKERARVAQGALDIQSAPNQGTQVTFTIPL